MAYTVQDAIDRARVLLQEVLFEGELDGVAWTNAELLMWANDAIAEIVRLAPYAYSKPITVPLKAGALQELPEGVSLLLEGVCNVTADGEDGRAVFKATRRAVDGEDPNWRSMPKTQIVRRCILSGSAPRTFEVYPPNDGTGYLRLICTSDYAPVVATDALPIPAVYLAAVVNYICYRAFGKEQENADAVSKSADFYQAFAGAVNGTAENYIFKTGVAGV